MYQVTVEYYEYDKEHNRPTNRKDVYVQVLSDGEFELLPIIDAVNKRVRVLDDRD